MVSIKFMRGLLLLAASSTLLGFHVRLAHAKSNNNFFEVTNGLRRQVADLGNKITWVSGIDFDNDLLTVPVDILDNPNPCNPNDLANGVCYLPNSFPQLKKDPYTYVYCPDLKSLPSACGGALIQGEFRVRTTTSEYPQNVASGPSVYISLEKDGTVGHVLYTGDTIYWSDGQNNSQDIEFIANSTYPQDNPCDKSSDPKDNYHQVGSCTIGFIGARWWSYPYNCHQADCSDPIVHVINANPKVPFTPPSNSPWIIAIVVAGAAFLGFGFWEGRFSAGRAASQRANPSPSP
jgi:hypothetical protein